MVQTLRIALNIEKFSTAEKADNGRKVLVERFVELTENVFALDDI